MSTPEVTRDAKAWLDSFIRQHGRPPRVLHIGNIANNAYLNAKLLNAAGLDCDVLCYDYYHIMACPEWEDADFEATEADQFSPDWAHINLHRFRRPLWFANGPLDLCVDYLIARRRGENAQRKIYWDKLSLANNTRSPEQKTIRERTAEFQESLAEFGDSLAASAIQFWQYLGSRRNNLILRTVGFLQHLATSRYPLPRVIRRVERLNNYRYPLGHFLAMLLIIMALSVSLGLKALVLPFRMVALRVKAKKKSIPDPDETHRQYIDLDDDWKLPADSGAAKELAQAWTTHWQRRFKELFPDRSDNLKAEEILQFLYARPKWRALFSHYDLVQGYSTDGLWALLAGAPYVAYEHGTIRKIPFEQTAQGRLCAMTYRQADYVCITNADNIVAAKALGLNKFDFVPHPINEGPLFARANRRLYKKLHTDLDSDFLVFHPSRQHWEPERNPNWEKGNDIFIRGFARFVKEANTRAKAIFVEWGNMVDKSKELISELGISGNIVWIQPQNTHGMARYILATDLLADQFYLGAFGSTLPRALACGRPAMIYLNTELHEWCFKEMPPVINVRTSDEVFAGLVTAYSDKEGVRNVATQGATWYRRYHSNQVIKDKLLSIYKTVLAGTNPRPS